jgi:hypothetical protein
MARYARRYVCRAFGSGLELGFYGEGEMESPCLCMPCEYTYIAYIAYVAKLALHVKQKNANLFTVSCYSLYVRLWRIP